ncbi:MAG: tetratricopeptide repeat protein, partial [Nitrospinota bacterium]
EGDLNLESEHIFPVPFLADPVSTYRKVIELAPANPLAEVAFLRIADFYRKKGEYLKALGTLQEFFGKYPESRLLQNGRALQAQTFLEQTLFYHSRGYFLRAIQTYTHFRATVPESVIKQARPFKAMLMVGDSYVRLGLHNQANQMFESILGDAEGVVVAGDEALFRLSQSHLQAGSRDRAGQVAQQFLITFPRSKLRSPVLALLGELAFAARDLREAASLLGQALEGELDDEVRGRSLFFLAEAQFQAGQYNQAADSMRQAIRLHGRVQEEIKPFSLEMAHYRLGDILYEGRRWLSAMVAYQNAAELFPQSRLAGWARHRVARVQEQLGLARGGSSQPGQTAQRPEPAEDAFWQEINRIRSESRVWDDRNLSRLERLLRGESRN